jgi:hypothetical protein
MIVLTLLASHTVKSIIGTKIRKEELLIVQDFGVQLCSYNMEGKLARERFVDISRIRDFVLNENLDWFTVNMYLAFIVEREKKLIIPFQVSICLTCLKVV